MPELVPILLCRIPAFDSTSQVDRSYKMSSHEEMREAVQVAEDTNDMAKRIHTQIGDTERRMGDMENRMGDITNMISRRLNDNEQRQEELAAM